MNRADSSGSPHKFGDASATLYLMRVNMTAKVIANLKTARKLLGNIGISRKKIKEVDLTTDFTLRDKILQKVGRNRQFPLIFIDNQPIGVSFHWLDNNSHNKLFVEKNSHNFIEFRTLMIWMRGSKNKLHNPLTKHQVHYLNFFIKFWNWQVIIFDSIEDEKVKDPSHILATPSSPSPFIQFNENIQTESQTGQFPQRIMQFVVCWRNEFVLLSSSIESQQIVHFLCLCLGTKISIFTLKINSIHYRLHRLRKFH